MCVWLHPRVCVCVSAVACRDCRTVSPVQYVPPLDVCAVMCDVAGALWAQHWLVLVLVHVCLSSLVVWLQTSGQTPLICAAAMGMGRVVLALLERGADVNAVNIVSWVCWTRRMYHSM